MNDVGSRPLLLDTTMAFMTINLARVDSSPFKRILLVY